MIKLQICCMIVIFFIMSVYFSTRRVKTYSHIVFSISLWVTVFNLAFDMITVYTVNHLDTVLGWVNRLCHVLFLGSLIMEVFICYVYSTTLIDQNEKPLMKKNVCMAVPVWIAWLGLLVLPIQYVETDEGNYSWGPAVFALYAIIIFYFILITVQLILHWREVEPKKRKVVVIAFLIEFATVLYQTRNSTSLISGFGLTMINLAFFLTVESPDVLLLEQLRTEKERADEANKAKSAFLSNMSHEIRTPMNAIVGMTELMLREKLSAEERGYLRNIKNSGGALLSIINDILDFSKIESGRMELIEAEYEPMSMLSDLSMIFLTRIGEKNVELLFDIDPKLPQKLFGDALRIRQVIINIVNNAIKFTEVGTVRLSIRMVKQTGDDLELSMSVQDTGQGIRRDDLDKLFGSFQQVDTVKNHNKEGTGLGLAISKQLVELMDGTIRVSSVYGEGSTFTFTIHQKLCTDQPAAEVHEHAKREKVLVSAFFYNYSLIENVRKLAGQFGVEYIPLDQWEKTGVRLSHLFTDVQRSRDIAAWSEEKFRLAGEIHVLRNPLLEDCRLKGVFLLNKPLYSLNFCQTINHEAPQTEDLTEDYQSLTAPEAHILIVDDNEMNLKVAVGLLKPLEMKVDLASGGKEAIRMARKTKYDIIFMDHMMPVMDGVETTEQLRAMDGDYFKNVPIIALSANAQADAREKFAQAGMDDFVAKPIEMKEICSKIKRWLPRELVLTGGQKSAETGVDANGDELPRLPGIDSLSGIQCCGGKEMWLSLLGDFYRLIEPKATKLEKCLADDLIRDYTIEVHALKNTARMIGAQHLSDRFHHMENCGNAGNVDSIRRETPDLLREYRNFKEVLKPFGEEQNEERQETTEENLKELLKQIHDAMDQFDLDGADEAMKELEKYKLPKECEELMEQLRVGMADVMMEEVMKTAEEMIALLDIDG